MQTPALLALEDGTPWHGTAFGACSERTGPRTIQMQLGMLNLDQASQGG
ncbi:MAG: hypothetical protein HZB51_11210 [Chloroflexi bacterium]|nr:hypothetical protein [Chloroflexota bacterium]